MTKLDYQPAPEIRRERRARLKPLAGLIVSVAGILFFLALVVLAVAARNHLGIGVFACFVGLFAWSAWERWHVVRRGP